MIDFDEYSQNLRKCSNFASAVNFEANLAIIKETLKSCPHNMLMGEDYQFMQNVYAELAPLENADLCDFVEFEKFYGRDKKR